MGSVDVVVENVRGLDKFVIEVESQIIKRSKEIRNYTCIDM